MQLTDLQDHLTRLGARPVHSQRLLRAWLQAVPFDTRHIHAKDFLPRVVRDAMPQIEALFAGLASVESTHPDSAGAVRLLVNLGDGQQVESVLLPRDGVCVSTQVGCAVGCRFCMTGQSGLIRQLGSAEIVAQVALARRQRMVRKVVFMGMGEPAHNLDNVLEAIQWLGELGAIGHKNLVFSTVGDLRVFERLPLGPVKPALAISLHTADPDLRAQLLPKAARIDPAELVELGERYARATSYPIQYQWTLLAGVNDRDEDVADIARLLKGKYAVMNLIPYNTAEGLPFARPSWERAAEMARSLHRQGVLTKLRHSAGQEVEGGCGQLRARALQHSPRRQRGVTGAAHDAGDRARLSSAPRQFNPMT